MRPYSLDDVLATRKRRDSWWTVFMVDPVACRVALFVANHTEITPNALTRFSLVLGMVSAGCFAMGHLVLGAVLFYVSFMIDCVDGKIARLKGTGTPFGLWLDYVGDRIRVVCCAAGLAYGQYAATGRLAFVLLGAGIAILDLFRYVNAPQMKRVRQTVKARRRAARREELDAVRDAMAVESLALDPEYDMPYAAAAAANEPPDPSGYDPCDPYDPYDQMADPGYRFEDAPPGPRAPGRSPGEHIDRADSADNTVNAVNADNADNADQPTETYNGPLIPRQASPSSEYGHTYPYDRAAPFDQASSHDWTGPHGHAASYGQAAPDGATASWHAVDARQVPSPPEGEEPPAGLRQRVGLCLARHRVRTHLMSGIEFHAAVFIVGPVLGPAALLPVTTGAGALLVLNEIFLVYRMWQSTRALAAGAAPPPAGPDDEPHVRTDPFFTGV
ncbi:CDP-alcohol phosphatidyltransferase family protein [Sphaerisporangium rhizosphaerae]|uniref:CDP-alcohol phosphatidyltransferase family protein n=1 Tax=Sphaerisporangium rhizosphaerae TaxID=2269375 RepID=A0ABW2P486_9ACTN